MVSALKADGARPRQKIQHRMRRNTKEKEHKRLDHRARSAPERRIERNRNADVLIRAGRPRNSHSYTLRRSETRTQTMLTRTVMWGTGAQRATVLKQGPPVAYATCQVTLFRGKRYLAHRSLGQLGLARPSKSQGTQPQNFPVL